MLGRHCYLYLFFNRYIVSLRVNRFPKNELHVKCGEINTRIVRINGSVLRIKGIRDVTYCRELCLW